MSSATSLESAPSESSTQLAGLSPSTPDTTLKQSDIPLPPQSQSNENDDSQSQHQEKKQTVFEIAQGIEENLNNLLKQLENTDTEINSKIDLALKNVNTLYDKISSSSSSSTSTN